MVIDRLDELMGEVGFLSLEDLNKLIERRQKDSEDAYLLAKKQVAVLVAIRDSLLAQAVATSPAEPKKKGTRGTVEPRVLEFMRSQDFPVKVRVIADHIGANYMSVASCLDRLRNKNLVRNTDTGWETLPIILVDDSPASELAQRSALTA